VSDAGNELPIFELPLVLLPTERVPLHVFEERYKRMVGASISESKPFGILFRDDSGPREVGCLATVEDVVERFEDGRLNVVVRGGRRFRVLARGDEPEEPRAFVEELDDGPSGESEDARNALAELIAAVGAEADAEGVGDGSYAIAAQVELGAPFKQGLLEEDDEGRRLDRLTAELRRLAGRARHVRALAERARGNGRSPVAEPD
jgi:Lon protease-like protein